MSILANDKVWIESSIFPPWISYSPRFHVIRLWHQPLPRCSDKKMQGLVCMLLSPWLLFTIYQRVLSIPSPKCIPSPYACVRFHQSLKSRPPPPAAPTTSTVPSWTQPSSSEIYLHRDVYILKMWTVSCPFLNRGFPDSLVGKESACNAGDPSLIPGSGRSAGEGIGYPLQYSGLENSMDYAVHRVAKSQTQLSDLKKKTFHLTTSLGFHFTFCETSMYV